MSCIPTFSSWIVLKRSLPVGWGALLGIDMSWVIHYGWVSDGRWVGSHIGVSEGNSTRHQLWCLSGSIPSRLSSN